MKIFFKYSPLRSFDVSWCWKHRSSSSLVTAASVEAQAQQGTCDVTSSALSGYKLDPRASPGQQQVDIQFSLFLNDKKVQSQLTSTAGCDQIFDKTIVALLTKFALNIIPFKVASSPILFAIQMKSVSMVSLNCINLQNRFIRGKIRFCFLATLH